MISTIITLAVGFILTGLIGNWLAQSWQHRNWLRQQRFLSDEKQYVALTQLWDQLSNLAGRRQWRMRRLLDAVSRSDEALIRARVADYDAIVSEWNENFTSMAVRLTLLARWHLAGELEREIQSAFQVAGSKLERLTRQRLAGEAISATTITALYQEVSWLSHRVFVFDRDTLLAVQRQRVVTYEGVKIPFERSNLDQFGNWQLLKALFKPWVKTLSIRRAPIEP